MQQAQLKTASEQLKRYLNVMHGQSATPKTAADVIKHLEEEIQVASAFSDVYCSRYYSVVRVIKHFFE